ncbi:hypothetical protein LQ901_06700 [Plesiomonas sp. PI-19]|nr:hypothetical protein [Plesiomonas sp. PI-19]
MFKVVCANNSIALLTP